MRGETLQTASTESGRLPGALEQPTERRDGARVGEQVRVLRLLEFGRERLEERRLVCGCEQAQLLGTVEPTTRRAASGFNAVPARPSAGGGSRRRRESMSIFQKVR